MGNAPVSFTGAAVPIPSGPPPRPRIRGVITLAATLFTTASVLFGVQVRAQSEVASGWHLVTIPDAWRKVPRGDLKPIDGFSWYRSAVMVPASWKGARLTLVVEALDDARASYINGVKVGATGTFPPRYRSGLGEPGRYGIDADRFRPGELNTIAIRVFQSDPRANFNVAPPVLLHGDLKQAIRMDGRWQYRPGDDARWSTATGEDFDVDSGETGAESGAEDGRNRGVFAKIDQVVDVRR